jgi:hypothetical protein
MSDKKSSPTIDNLPEEIQPLEKQPAGCKIREWFTRYDDLFFFIIMAVLAFWVRWALIPYESGDYLIGMGDWYN